MNSIRLSIHNLYNAKNSFDLNLCHRLNFQKRLCAYTNAITAKHFYVAILSIK